MTSERTTVSSLLWWAIAVLIWAVSLAWFIIGWLETDDPYRVVSIPFLGLGLVAGLIAAGVAISLSSPSERVQRFYRVLIVVIGAPTVLLLFRVCTSG